MKDKRVIVLSSIKPFRSLKSTLEVFDKNVKLCEAEGYTKEVPRLIGLLSDFGFLDAGEWFDEILPRNCSAAEAEERRPEIEMIVLCGRMLLVRLNNLAQKHLNGFGPATMGTTAEQLMKDDELMKFFPNTVFQ